MPRGGVTTAVAGELEAQQMRPALFVQCAFASSTEYMWTGRGPFVWNGHTWLGIGTFGTVSPVPETNGVQSQGITLSLSGIDATLLNEALTECRPGLPCRVYLGFLDASGNIIPNPIQTYAGLMDEPTIDIGTDTATISIAVENRMSDLQRPIGRRYTDTDRRLDYPGDGIFKFIQQLQDWNGKWG